MSVHHDDPATGGEDDELLAALLKAIGPRDVIPRREADPATRERFVDAFHTQVTVSFLGEVIEAEPGEFDKMAPARDVTAILLF